MNMPQSELDRLAKGTQAPRTWAGHGTGATCAGCSNPVLPHEIEYEIESGDDTPALHFHFVCYRNWTGRGVR
jgi:hypothetical protein